MIAHAARMIDSLGRDRVLSVALAALAIGAVLVWPLTCSDTGLLVTLILAGLTAITAFVLLHTGGIVSALGSALASLGLGAVTVLAAAIIVAFTCAWTAVLS